MEDLPPCRGTSPRRLWILTERQNTSTVAANLENSNIPS